MTKLYFIFQSNDEVTPRISFIKPLSCSINRNFKLQLQLSKTRFLPDMMLRSCIPIERSRANVTVVIIDTEAWWRGVDRWFSSPATSVTRARVTHIVVLREKIVSTKEESIKGQTRRKKEEKKRGGKILRTPRAITERRG